jgi:hypothetical protein
MTGFQSVLLLEQAMSDQKAENNNLIKFIAAAVETMRDQLATRSDLAQLEERLTTKVEVEITAVRGDIEQVHIRLDSVEKLLRMRLDNIEAEVSRLRSVLYLLVKDRPDMLRLLGHTPPGAPDEVALARRSGRLLRAPEL